MPFTTFRVLFVQAIAFDIELLAFNATTEAPAVPHDGALPGGGCCCALVWFPVALPQGHVAPRFCKAEHATKVWVGWQVCVGHVLLFNTQPPTLLTVQH
jgi:hypothetical protein